MSKTNLLRDAKFWNNLDALVAQASSGTRPGPDWFTTAEYAEGKNFSQRMANYKLHEAVKKGLLLEKKVRHNLIYWKVK